MQAVPCPARFLDEACAADKVRRHTVHTVHTGNTGNTFTMGCSSSKPQGVVLRGRLYR